MWNYIYFAHYLDCRKQSGHELTAVEKYVDDKVWILGGAIHT